MWKQRIIQAIWIAAGAGTLVLLVAAMQKKSGKVFSEIQVEITGATEHVFVDEKDVKELMQEKGTGPGKSLRQVKLRSIEEMLEKDPWIQNAELFFDNKQVLQVRITERQPVARVFTLMGNSFYLDSSGKALPLSDKLSARVPVFTGLPFSNKPGKTDSALLQDVLRLSRYIVADSFWNAQLAQIDVDDNRFEMVPVIGNHIIRFGAATDIDKKFKKLFSFYRNVSARVGFDVYETINLEYDGQIVATRRGAAKPLADSAAAIRQLEESLQSVQGMAKDTIAAKTPASKRQQAPATQPKPKAVMRK